MKALNWVDFVQHLFALLVSDGAKANCLEVDMCVYAYLNINIHI